MHERTLLVYSRTSLSLFVTGISLIQFFQYKVIVYVGYGFISLGIFMLAVGFRRYVKSKRFIYIPLSELRQRTNEIPKDKPVYLHCRTGQRSYNAALALQNLGYSNVYNITGSFLALSIYEYFNDKTKGRESMVTEYNFR